MGQIFSGNIDNLSIWDSAISQELDKYEFISIRE